MQAQDIALHPMVRCRDLPDALRLSGLHNTFSPAVFTPHTRKKAHPSGWASSLYLMPGSSLLSHGETPHYHRRYGVSLLSSAWGQVGPPRYSRQANSVYQTALCVLM